MEAGSEMTSPERRLRRYSTVLGVVAAHKDYGLLLRLENDDEGFVDSSDVADAPVRPQDWPPVGTRLTAVVLGPTRMGRWRLSLRDGDVEVVTALEDPEAEFGRWNALKRDGQGSDPFFSAPGDVPLFRWALARPQYSSERKLAEELITAAPESIKDQLSSPDRGDVP